MGESGFNCNFGVAEYKYDNRSFRSLEPVVGAIHELPLPRVSYINSATPKFETISENSVIQLTTEKRFPVVSQKMFNQLEFIDSLKKSSGNDVYQWISNSFDCNVLAPNQNWRKGTITLELLFYPGEIKLIGNDTVISLPLKYTKSSTKDLSFFTPDKFERIINRTQEQEAYKLINNKLECRILVPSKEWQNGKIGLFLVFCPEQENINTSDVQPESVNSSLDGIREIISEISPLDEIRQLASATATEQN